MQLAAAGEDLKKLREIAAALIEKAAVGDLQAIKELADRLDGKPALALEHAVPENGGIRRFVREIVHVTETREEIENQDLVVDFHEIRPRNGNGGVDEN